MGANRLMVICFGQRDVLFGEVDELHMESIGLNQKPRFRSVKPKPFTERPRPECLGKPMLGAMFAQGMPKNTNCNVEMTENGVWDGFRHAWLPRGRHDKVPLNDA